MLKSIKWAYQRVKYGYDDRIYWGFEDHLQIIIMPLKKFCEEQLKLDHIQKFNPDRVEVYMETLRRIEALEELSSEAIEWSKKSAELWGYFGANIGFYWD